MLDILGQLGPISANVFTIFELSYRQLPLDVQLSMALLTLNFVHFWSFCSIRAIYGHFSDIHLMCRLSWFINFKIWSFWLKIGVTYATYRGLYGSLQKIV